MNLTIAQIDHLIAEATAIPVSDRGAGWQATIDSLLDERERVRQGAGGTAPIATRILHPTETR